MAKRSLLAQQEAMAVTGNNLANVNNAGYSREQLNVHTSTSLSTYYGYEGTGIDAGAVTQVRSAILDNQIQSEGSVTGSLTAQQQALQNAEAQLGEQITSTGSTSAASSPNGISAAISDFFAKISALAASATNASDASAQAAVVASAQTLVSRLNSAGTGLANLRTNLNASITSDVTAANQDLQTISDLNKQIVSAQATGGTPNELIDQRQKTLEDLASKINVTTVSDPQGRMDVVIGGVSLISSTDNLRLQTFDGGGGQLFVATTASPTTSMTLTGGSIEGNITTRDQTLNALQSSLDSLSGNLISQFNTVYMRGTGTLQVTGQNFFTGTDASTIGINSSVVTNPALFQSSSSYAYPGDTSNAVALANLGSTAIAGLGNQTFSQNYTSAVSSFASTLASVNDQINNSGSITTMLTNQRDSVSGVNVDEETTHLVQYQKAYQASAELITTLNQMLETVLAMKT